MSRPRPRRRIVIVGAGFAGFHAARHLARLAKHTTGIEVVLVNPTPRRLTRQPAGCRCVPHSHR